MEVQSAEISSSTESESPPSPSMLDNNNFAREYERQVHELNRPPSPWVQQLLNAPQPNEQEEVLHVSENALVHFNFEPPEPYQMIPAPIFRSVYNPGSCPYWRNAQYVTNLSLSSQCEDCRDITIIIQQNDVHQIQLSTSQFFAMYDCIRNNFAARQ